MLIPQWWLYVDVFSLKLYKLIAQIHMQSPPRKTVTFSRKIRLFFGASCFWLTWWLWTNDHEVKLSEPVMLKAFVSREKIKINVHYSKIFKSVIDEDLWWWKWGKTLCHVSQNVSQPTNALILKSKNEWKNG